MLVFVSDLHLNDGSAPSSNQGAMELLAERLGELAMRASWRADGRYRPVDRIDLVLLGDTLDLTRSRRWLHGEARPWSGPNHPGVAETASSILDGILQNNASQLAVLRSLSADGIIRLPPASVHGQPIYQAERLPIPVLIHFVVGESDWLLHVPGPSFDLLRQKVVHHLGIACAYNQPFPHDPADSEVLLDALRRHRVLARHGDIYDPLAFHEVRDASSLGETLAIEVGLRFLVEVEQQYANDVPAATWSGLRDLDHVRPLGCLPAYLDSLLSATCPRMPVRKALKDLWDRCVDRWLEQDFARPGNGLVGADLTGAMALRLRVPRLADAMASKSNGMFDATDENHAYATHALAEADLRNRRASHVVYGHTHVAGTMPLEVSHAEGFVLQQTYFNTGAWQRVYRPTMQIAGRYDFSPVDALTLSSFFTGDERGGRPYETWTGTLGVATSQATIPRESPVSVAPAALAGVSFSPAHAAVRGPHFNVGAPIAIPRR